MILRIASYLLLLISISSCMTKPLQTSHFIGLDISKGLEKSEELTLDIEDTLNTLMLEICMQLKNNQLINEYEAVPLLVEIISPTGISLKDTIDLPLNVKGNSRVYSLSGGVRNYQWPYRRNIKNNIPGKWRFYIAPANKTGEGSIYNGIIGVGISCKKDEQNQ